MIIVTGHAISREITDEEMQRLAVEHVLRSRAEPGCISHEVTRDVEHPRRFVFFERWNDMAALQLHIRLQTSRDFAKALIRLSDGKPEMAIFQADSIKFG